MTTLSIIPLPPPLPDRFQQTLREETFHWRQADESLQAILRKGFVGAIFRRAYEPLLAQADRYRASLATLPTWPAVAEERQQLQTAVETFRHRLIDIFAYLDSLPPPRQLDPELLRAKEEAYQRGEMKPLRPFMPRP